jgi:perosamine synthetase
MISIYKPYLPPSSLRYAHEALDSGWLSSQGPYLQKVSERLQELLGVKYALPVFNGTVACHLMARCTSDITGLHEVIVPDNVYVAAWNAFLFDGDYELFTVPCDIETWNYDMVALQVAMAKHPAAAVLIVHNLGNIINVPELQEQYPETLFLEDNCEGFAGMYNGQYSGTASDISAISFYGNKNCTSGEGGALLTNSEEIYLYAKNIHSQGGSEKRFIHNNLGTNYRMTNIQAAILYGQIEVLPEIMEMKHEVFETYRSALKDREDVLTQKRKKGTKHANWMFGCRVPGQKSYEAAEAFFSSKGIEIRPMFYPITAHRHLQHQAYIDISECQNAELLNKECIILPSYPELTKEEQKHILKTLDEYIRDK